MSRLPTLSKLKAHVSDTIDVAAIAQDWFEQFSKFVSAHDVDGILSILCEDGLWRDILSLTWDFRTFDGHSKIAPFLNQCMENITDIRLDESSVRLQRLYPDLVWIICLFNFTTSVGLCSGVIRLVPTESQSWMAYTVFTNLENLKSFPEKIGPLREQQIVTSAQWGERRTNGTSFTRPDPSVLIVGGGHSALSLAARLKSLDVDTLIVEKDLRVGDSWRNRYDSMCLHFPVWFDHMPYLPFPPSWPLYTPGKKMADWLEAYATILELNVWTSSKVLSATQEENKKWKVTVEYKNGNFRTFHVNHLVIATGVGDGIPNIPELPGKDKYRGNVLHSTQYLRATDYIGKKVLVIGTGNSGHDIASDLAIAGIDVTIFQRSSTFVMSLQHQWKFLGGAIYNESGQVPLDIADRLVYSIPHLLQANGMAQRSTAAIMNDYRETLDKLSAIGYRVNSGINDTGLLLLQKEKGGGHYFDIGATKLLIEGKIKLKNDSLISAFDSQGLIFENGSILQADVIIYATGCGDMRESIRRVCGDMIADECPPLLGVNLEGEMNWYHPLRTGLWHFTGSLSINRFYSKCVALQIKAMEENIITEVLGYA